MKSNLTLALLFAAALTLPSCNQSADPTASEPASKSPQVTTVDAVGASQLLSSNADMVVLDVRTPAEHAEGHLPGTVINVDFKGDNFREEAAKLDRDTPYLLHCRSGARSTASLEILEDLGFTNIHHFDGGANAWTASGEALEK